MNDSATIPGQASPKVTPVRPVAVIGGLVAFVRFRLVGLLAWPPWARSRGGIAGRFLVSGPSGAGKSSAGAVLRACGFDVVEADDEFGYFANLTTGEPVPPPPDDAAGWYETHGWHWDRAKVERVLLDPARTPLFVCGGADNEFEFHDRFDGIFFLDASDTVIQRRLRGRRGDDHTGRPAWIAHLLSDHQEKIWAKAREHSTVIDGERSRASVVRQILRHAAEASRA